MESCPIVNDARFTFKAAINTHPTQQHSDTPFFKSSDTCGSFFHVCLKFLCRLDSIELTCIVLWKVALLWMMHSSVSK